eukprot:Sspe_Gene.19890::Locus_7276_Transcript_1_1_Confidence_1.000_Length_6714::g.19890::m.19890/K04854/CACNA1G; voltage-dependent calcium channel T type alpha-1G
MARMNENLGVPLLNGGYTSSEGRRLDDDETTEYDPYGYCAPQTESITSSRFPQPKYTQRQLIESHRAFFCGYADGWLRSVCLDLICNPWFDRTILFLIVINAIFISLDDPLDPRTKSTTWMAVQEMVDEIFLGIFILEMVIKMVAMGGFMHETAYFRQPWNVLDFIIVSSGAIGLFTSNQGTFSILRVVRIFRPLRTISRVKGMRDLVNTLVGSLPVLGNVLLLCFFLFFVFCLIGVVMWSGTLHQRCYGWSPADNAYVWANVCGNHSKLDYFHHGCPANFTCISGAPNPFAWANWDHVGAAFLVVWQCLTLDDWVSHMYHIQDGWSPFGALYFVCLTLLGAFFVLNLVLAVVTDSFTRFAVEDEDKKLAGAREGMEMMLQQQREQNRPEAQGGVREESFQDDETATLRSDASSVKDESSLNKDDQWSGAEVKGTFDPDDRNIAARSRTRQNSLYLKQNVPGAQQGSQTLLRDNYTRREWRRFTGEITKASKAALKNIRKLETVREEQQTNVTEAARARSRAATAVVPFTSQMTASGYLRRKSDGGVILDRRLQTKQMWESQFQGKGLRSLTDESRQKLISFTDSAYRVAPPLQVGDVSPPSLANPAKSPRRERKRTMIHDVPEVINENPEWMTEDAMKSWKLPFKSPQYCLSIRSAGQDLVHNRWFTNVITVLIIINALLLSIEHYHMSSALVEVLEMSNLIFVSIFSFETAVKIFALGLRQWWDDKFNVFDLVIVAVSVMEVTFLNSSTATVFRVLRLARVIRVVKLARRWKILNHIVKTVGSSLAYMGYLILLLLLFIFVFAILGRQLFAGKIPRCCTEAERAEGRFNCYPDTDEFYIYDSCWNSGTSPWKRPHFDNLFWSAVLVFQIVTEDYWTAVMYKAMSSVGPEASIYFFAVLLLGRYLLLNLFVAILLVGLEREHTRRDDTSSVGDIPGEAICGALNDESDEEESAYPPALKYETQQQELLQRKRMKIDERKQRNSSFRMKYRRASLPAAQLSESPLSFGGNSGPSPMSADPWQGWDEVPRSNGYGGNVVSDSDFPSPHGGGESDSTGYPRVRTPRTPSPRMRKYRRHRSQSIFRQLKEDEQQKDKEDDALLLPGLGEGVQKVVPSKAVSKKGSAPSRGRAPSGGRKRRMSHASTFSTGDEAANTRSDPMGFTETTFESSGPQEPQAASQPDGAVYSRKGRKYITYTESDGKKVTFRKDPTLNGLLEWRAIIVREDGTEEEVLVGHSWGCIPPDNPVRVFLWRIVDGTYFPFEKAIGYLIFASCASLIVNGNMVEHNYYVLLLLEILDLMFSFIFVCEIVIRITVYTFNDKCAHNAAYIKRARWNWLDCLIVGVSVVMLPFQYFITSSRLTSAYKVARALRAWRPLRILVRSQNMKIVITALVWTIPSVFNVFAVALVSYFMFGVATVQLFKGSFMACNDGSNRTISECSEDTYFVKTQAVPFNTWYNDSFVINATYPMGVELIRRRWVNMYAFNFNDIGSSVLTLLQCAILNGWIEVLYAIVDSTNQEDGPTVRDNQQYMALVMVAWIFFGGLGIMNVFVGCVVDYFSCLKTRLDRSALLTRNQMQALRIKKILRHQRAKHKLALMEDSGCIARACFRVCDSRFFQPFVVVCIVLNVLTMATIHYQQTAEWSGFQRISNITFTAIFTIEMVLKIGVVGVRGYLATMWNKLDGAIVVSSWAELSITEFVTHGNAGSIVQLLRVGRILRLVRHFKGLKKLLLTLYYSIPALINVGSLLALVFFIYGIMAMVFFERVRKVYFDDNYLNEHVNFDTFPRSVLSLYRVATFDNWRRVMVACLLRPPACREDLGDGESDCGATTTLHTIVVSFFFSAFVLTVGFVMLNLFIAVVLENFRENVLLPPEIMAKMELIKMFRAKWSYYDPTAVQIIKAYNFVPLMQQLPSPIGFADCEVREILPSLLHLDFPVTKESEILFIDAIDAIGETVFKIKLVDREATRGHLGSRRKDLRKDQERYQNMFTIGDWYAACVIQAAWRRWYGPNGTRRPFLLRGDLMADVYEKSYRRFPLGRCKPKLPKRRRGLTRKQGKEDMALGRRASQLSNAGEPATDSRTQELLKILTGEAARMVAEISARKRGRGLGASVKSVLRNSPTKQLRNSVKHLSLQNLTSPSFGEAPPFSSTKVHSPPPALESPGDEESVSGESLVTGRLDSLLGAVQDHIVRLEQSPHGALGRPKGYASSSSSSSTSS